MQTTGANGSRRLFNGERSHVCARLFALLLAFAFSTLVRGQTPAPFPGASTNTASSEQQSIPSGGGLAPESDTEGGLIKLDVDVTDQAGNPVTGLAENDFTMLDQGEPVKIVSFRGFDESAAKTTPPGQVILVLDELNLIPSLIPDAKNEIEKFLQQNGGHLAQPASVLILTRDGLLWVDASASSDGNALAAEIARNHKPGPTDSYIEFPSGLQGGNTAIQRPGYPVPMVRSSGLRALQALADLAVNERQQPGRKIVIWIGPGSGIGSGAYFDRAQNQQQLFSLIVWFSTLLREARIALYSASVGNIDTQQTTYTDHLKAPESVKRASFGDLARDVLAVQSGGGVPEPRNDLAGEIAGCVKSANSFYRISFDPSHAKQLDEYHEMVVRVDKAGFTVRTNAGYYDEPFYAYQPIPGTRRLTVQDLEQLLGEIHAKRDGEVARQLAGVQLTERLSRTKLATWLQTIRGEKARRALVAVADLSLFLAPPPSEIQSDHPPTAQEQQQIIALARDYLGSTIPKLPNFYARRTSIRYLENSTYDDANAAMEYRPMHKLDTSQDTVLYRGGQEVVGSAAEKQPTQISATPDFTTYGTFGPALGLMSDLLASLGEMQWSRWEEGASGRRAVFRFRVPVQRSRYRVGGCCLPEGDGARSFGTPVGYDGEIAIDPKTGAILRFEAEADLKDYLPFARSDIVLLYGPVDIGGRTYICPLKSVSIWYARSVRVLKEWNASFRTYGPYWTMVNDFEFDQFHIFRSSSRIVSADPVANHDQ